MSTKKKDDLCTCFYSYISSKSKKILLGPLCMNCMNIFYQDDPTQFHSQEEQDSNVSIYLHTEEGGKPCSMNELIYLNGSSTPFTLRKLAKQEKLRSFNCVAPKCDYTFNSTNGPSNPDSGASTPDFREIAPGSESSINPPNFAALGCIEGVEGFSAENCAFVDGNGLAESDENDNGIRNDLKNVHKTSHAGAERSSNQDQGVLVSDKFSAKFPLLFGATREQTQRSIVNVSDWELCKKPISCALFKVENIPDGPILLKKELDKRNWKTESCEVCPNMDGSECYVQHVTSDSHREKLLENGRYVTDVHFHILLHFIDSFLAKFDRKWKGMRGVSFSLRTRPLPFLKGVSNGMDAADVRKVFAKYRIVIEKAGLEVLSEYYVGYFSEIHRCPMCDVEISAAPAIVHVLSEAHLEKIISSGRSISLNDMLIMSGFFKQLVKKQKTCRTSRVKKARKVRQLSDDSN